MAEIYSDIKKDKIIWKFCFYGLFKNLKFFEPYLLIYLLSTDINYFQIGTLYSIREMIKYIFEIPSGIMADHYGRKTELMLCFVFYIISFFFFFIGGAYLILIAGMIFFGLGEAFRSGTHKSMIYCYLERKGWFEYKSFAYGRTRSFSLIGSSISAFLSIIFALNLKNLNILFALSVLPYIADFLLISSYPDYLNEKTETDVSIKKFVSLSIMQFREIFSNFRLLKMLANISFFESIFKSMKDYIQPVIQIMLLGGGIVFFGFTEDQTSKLFMGAFYGVIYIINSYASQNVYRLVRGRKTYKVMNYYYPAFAFFSFAVAFGMTAGKMPVVIVSYALIFMLFDTRKPLFVDAVGDIMSKNQRATVLSIQSQTNAWLIAVLSPLFGLIADNFSVEILFIVIGTISFIIGIYILNKKGEN